MFQAIRTRIALAAAALAIVATSSVPAVATFAAPLTPSQEHAMTALPDVSVVGVGINGSDSSYWTGAFKISNKGPAAKNVKLEVYCTYNNAYTHQYDGSIALPTSYMTLDANQQIPSQKAVNCPGRWGKELRFISMFATVPGGDANTSNNQDAVLAF
jgi:hypothetical protein